jgi:signal transduction histidine kinase
MEKGGVLKIITRVSSNDIEVLFSDEGCGIPDKFLEMIFEPLYTTKVKGVGLGLAVSKSMAEANAGSISVESTEGKGSTFTVRFMDKTSPHVVNF